MCRLLCVLKRASSRRVCSGSRRRGAWAKDVVKASGSHVGHRASPWWLRILHDHDRDHLRLRQTAVHPPAAPAAQDDSDKDYLAHARTAISVLRIGLRQQAPRSRPVPSHAIRFRGYRSARYDDITRLTCRCICPAAQCSATPLVTSWRTLKPPCIAPDIAAAAAAYFAGNSVATVGRTKVALALQHETHASFPLDLDRRTPGSNGQYWQGVVRLATHGACSSSMVLWKHFSRVL